ncbi:MAG TPA: efflux RND transporter periplasmic adaptor subunit [Steroidobacteraceae bacterium]|jgi:RND family efflux transporter MFP subunit|nr:efflux RND transporter periplasmic adaptor subunit [Steroidobacteraceae bacterium]
MSVVSNEFLRMSDTATNARRGFWIRLGLIGAAALFVALLAWRLTQALTVKHVPNKDSIPTVSVTEVAVSTVPTTVSIIGTIAARYDMPIGVEGDAGRVAAIYVEAGDHVKRGQVLGRLNVSVLEPQVTNLEAALEQARAEAELAEAEYRRAQAVGASGALSAEETQRRKSAAVTAGAKVKVAAAQLAEARARLARAEVRAPADGIILTRNVEVGQTATPGGEALFRLSEGGEVELRGQVAEQDLPLLKVGQSVNVHLTGTTQVYPGRVRLLGAVIDPQTRLGMARVALTPDPNLRPGAFARAEVTVSNAERAVLPQTAVLTDDKGSYVLIVNAQHKVERRAVHVSGMVQNGVTIADGISGKEQVVATAGAFLQEGELVNPVLKQAGQT